jgi:hypothetical protein
MMQLQETSANRVGSASRKRIGEWAGEGFPPVRDQECYEGKEPQFLARFLTSSILYVVIIA